MVSRIVKENAISGMVFLRFSAGQHQKADRDKHAEHPQPSGDQRDALMAAAMYINLVKGCTFVR